MSFVPTCKVTVLEPVDATDDYGDPIDEYSAVRSGVPAHISEKSRRTLDPQSGQLLTVRFYKGLLPAKTPVVVGSRLRDLTNDRYYKVEHVVEHKSFVGAMPVSVEMQRDE